jgi:hypothetical protein
MPVAGHPSTRRPEDDRPRSRAEATLAPLARKPMPAGNPLVATASASIKDQGALAYPACVWEQGRALLPQRRLRNPAGYTGRPRQVHPGSIRLRRQATGRPGPPGPEAPAPLGTIRVNRTREGAAPLPQQDDPPPTQHPGKTAGQTYRTSSPVTVRPISIRWISEVPSKIVKIWNTGQFPQGNDGFRPARVRLRSWCEHTPSRHRGPGGYPRQVLRRRYRYTRSAAQGHEEGCGEGKDFVTIAARFCASQL